MAEVTAFRNNALPYPIYGAPWVVVFPMLDEDGDPVTGLTCDSEVSKNGDTGVDCTNEGVEIPYTTATNKGMYYLILTAAEMTADIVTVTVYSGAATTQATCITLYPRKLVSLRAGTSAGGDTAYITLDANASAIDDWYNGCVCVATIDSNVECRVITDYTGSNKRAAVTPAWNVAPDDNDTFIIYLTEGVQVNQANITHVAGTAQTARDIGASVLLSSGTGTGQLDFTSGVVKANLAQILGTALTETSGQIAAAFKKFFDKATPTGTVNSLPDAVPGANGGLPTTNGTKVNQTVDLTAGQSIEANGGTVATVTTLTNLPAIPNDWLTAAGIKADAITEIQSGLATPTNITAASGVTLAATQTGVTIPTVTTVGTTTNLTNLPAVTTDWLTAAGVKADAVTKIQSGLATPTNITAGTITTTTNLTNLPAITANWLTAAGIDATAVTELQAGLALEATLTAIKGAGWSTETLAALDVLIDAIKAKTDLITTGTTVTIASPVSGSTITAQRGDTLTFPLENIGALTNNSKLWFTVKDDHDDADSTALVQIEKTGGLLYINGAAAVTSANGSLTVDDIPTGDVTIVLAAAETAKLSTGSYHYDIQILRSAGTPVSTLTSGTFIVAADVTRATA